LTAQGNTTSRTFRVLVNHGRSNADEPLTKMDNNQLSIAY
jgi:hypothetical protein